MAIQQSLGAMMGSVASAATLGRGVQELKEQKELQALESAKKTNVELQEQGQLAAEARDELAKNEEAQENIQSDLEYFHGPALEEALTKYANKSGKPYIPGNKTARKSSLYRKAEEAERVYEEAVSSLEAVKKQRKGLEDRFEFRKKQLELTKQIGNKLTSKLPKQYQEYLQKSTPYSEYENFDKWVESLINKQKESK